jgi:TetR/AcrR family transcriptional repressor of nem operon
MLTLELSPRALSAPFDLIRPIGLYSVRMVIGAIQRKRGRPRTTGAVHSDTREALCRAGVAALTEKGFSATGIDEILRAAGVPKGSFYYYFASKEAFGSELITRYAAYFAGKLDRHFRNDLLSPMNRLRAFIADVESGMARFKFRRGCLVGNLGQEMGALPDSYREQLAEVFCDWQARTAQCLEAARRAGEIAKDADPAQLAAFFWIGWEGAVLRAKLERNAGPLRLFAQSFLAGLERRRPYA